MAERRAASRARHDSVLELYDASGRLLERSVRLVDVSATGARLTTTAVLRKGGEVRGRLRLLKEGVKEFGGRVLWVKERTNSNLYGIAFDWVR